MKLLRHVILICTIQFCICTTLTSQNYQALRDSMEAEYKSNETHQSRPFPRYKHWARYSLWQSSHLDEDGMMIHIPRHNAQIQKQINQLSDQRAAFANWTFVGPSHTTGQSKGLGRIDRIEFHPTNANIIYVGTPAGGLWQTTNAGASWTPLTDELPTLGVSGIVVDHTNTNRLFILTGTGDGNGFSSIFNYRQASMGVFRSNDGGATWEQMGAFPNTDGSFFGYKLEQSPFDPDFLLATTSQGLFRSLDRGQTWLKVFANQCYDIEFSYTGNKVFVTVGPSPSLVVSSTDFFNTWDPINYSDNGPAPSGRWEMTTTPGEPCRFYLFCGTGDASSDSFNAFYESIDCGNTFTPRDNTPNILGSPDVPDSDGQANYDMAIACHPGAGQGHIVLTGGLVLYRSTNHGQGWTKNTDYFENVNDPTGYIHPDVHDVAYNPLNNNVYAATDGGLYVSTDNGNQWTNISAGLETSMIYNLIGTELNSSKLLTGHQDNGIQLRNINSTTFEFLQTGDGFSVQFSPTNSGHGYNSVNYSLYKWTNSFSNVSSITPSDANAEDHFFPRILVHNTDPNKLICSYAVTRYSNDGGQNWIKPDLSVNGRGFHALIACPSNNNRVYAAGAPAYNSDFSLIYRSDNFGQTWTNIGLGTGYPDADARVTGIAVHPNQSANLWVAMGQLISGQKVYYSGNAGASWTNMTADLPNVVVNTIAVDENNGVYIGTDIGVFYRNLFSSGWTHYSNFLPNSPIASLYINHSTDELYAGTYGRGVWKSSTYTACVNHVLVPQLQGDYFYQANVSISLYGESQGSIGTKGTLKSGDYILFLPGFEAKSGQQVQTKISPCGTGG